MALNQNRIRMPYLILCEGIDTTNFIICYLNSKALAYDERFSGIIQALNFGGIDDLQMYLGNLTRMDGFESVRHILVLRDAEKDVSKAERMVKNAFRANGLLVPDRIHEWTVGSDEPNTAFTLLPACNSNPVNGALEDLCWDLLRDPCSNAMRGDIQTFIDGIKRDYGTVSTHEHKSRLHTYFSVSEKYVSLKVGEAARAGAFAWESKRLDGLKTLMAEGFTDIR